MTAFATRKSLRADLAALGLAPGDAVLVHAALRKVGPMLGGPDSLIDALTDAVGPDGTILGYCDWQGQDDAELRPDLRDDIPPFDPLRSRSTRDNGAFPELLRTTPGAKRSASTGASMAALGGKAEWFTAGHALDYGYGQNSPLGKLVEAGGKTLLLGAPRYTMTLLHHAEHVADIPGKLIRHYDVPMLIEGKTVWRQIEEFNTSIPVVEGLDDEYFVAVVTEFLDRGHGRTGKVGLADCVLVEAREIVPFTVEWLESRFPKPAP